MSKKFTVQLPKADGLFGAQNTEAIININLDEIADYHNHTYSVDENSDEMKGLIESFILNPKAVEPITVRTSDAYGKPYECIAGHRRRHAARCAGRNDIPAIVVDMDDDEADIWMVDSNANTRSTVSLKELCYSLKVKYDALKKLSKNGSRSDELLGDENSMSRSKVQDLIKLTKLTSGLFALVEDKKMTAQVGKAFAALNKSDQLVIEGALLSEEKTPKVTPELAQDIVELAGTPNFSQENVLNILFDVTAKEKKPSFKITEKEINAWFPVSYDGSVEDKKELISKLVRDYFALEDWQ